MNSAVVVVLKKARALIEQGWTQGAFKRYTDNPDRPIEYCAVGAIREASNSEVWGELYDAGICLSTALRGMAYTHDPIEFNDAPGRTREEVLEMFDKAIAAGCA